MKLSVENRIILGSLFSFKGSYETLIIQSDIRKKTEITQEEVVTHQIKELEGGTVSYNKNSASLSEKEIKFTEAEKEEVKRLLREASERKELHISMIPLYKLFVK